MSLIRGSLASTLTLDENFLCKRLLIPQQAQGSGHVSNVVVELDFLLWLSDDGLFGL